MDLPDAPAGSASSPPAQPAPPDATSPWGLPAQPPGCEMCGSVPAEQITLRQGVGMLFLRRTRTMQARVCRDCGVALFRKIQSATLLTGWWGIISFFLNFGTIWSNYAQRRSLDALGAPSPPSARTAQTPRATPLPIGRPTLLRPQSLGVVGAAVVVMLLLGLWGDPSSSSSAQPVGVGTCGTLNGSQVRYPVDCTDRDADVRIVAILPAGSADSDCPADATGASSSQRYGFVCWGPA